MIGKKFIYKELKERLNMNMIFKLFCVEDYKTYNCYAVRNDSKGYPHFLIYANNQWIWRSAKHFKPIEE